MTTRIVSHPHETRLPFLFIPWPQILHVRAPPLIPTLTPVLSLRLLHKATPYLVSPIPCPLILLQGNPLSLSSYPCSLIYPYTYPYPLIPLQGKSLFPILLSPMPFVSLFCSSTMPPLPCIPYSLSSYPPITYRPCPDPLPAARCSQVSPTEASWHPLPSSKANTHPPPPSAVDSPSPCPLLFLL